MLNNIWFLTDKHCFNISGPLSQITTIKVHDTNAGDQQVGATQIAYHPTSNVDIALVRLDQTVTLNGSKGGFARPIYQGATSALPGTFVDCVGYGESVAGAGDFGTLRQTNASLLIQNPPTNPPPISPYFFFVLENVIAQIPGHGDSGGACYDYNTGQLYGVTQDYYQNISHPWEVQVTSVEFFRDFIKTTLGSHIGTFNNGSWWLDRDGNHSWASPPDKAVGNFGPGLQPIVVHSGAITSTPTPRTSPSHIGAFYGPGPGNWYIDANDNYTWNNSPPDKLYPTFGGSADIPVSGQWGLGTKDNAIGVFRLGSWYQDMNINGVWDGPSTDRFFSSFGQGITPVTGSWTGVGTNIGAFDGTHWYLDMNGDGVWQNGSDKTCTWGQAGDKPVVGDWNNDGVDEIGTYNSGSWWLDMDGNCSFTFGVDSTFSGFGQSTDTPVAGRWF